MSEEYVFICPRCGQQAPSYYELNTIINCRFCDTKTISTHMESNEYSDCIRNGTADIIDRRLFEQYVKDNPLYDPKEAELSEAKLQRDHEQQEAWIAESKAKQPHCPVCNSTNVKRIGAVRKGVSIAVLGLFSGDIGKTMVCNNCGYKF